MKKIIIGFLILALWIQAQDHFQAVCNQDYYPKLQKLIGSAKNSICINGLSMKSTNAKIKDLIELLKKSRLRGVDVKIVLEADHGGVGKQNQTTLKVLAAMGINARADSTQSVTHSKLAIVDMKYVLIGSTNLTHNSLTNNNESNLFIESTDAASFYKRFFDNLWNSPAKSLAIDKKSKDGDSIYFTNDKFLDVIKKSIDSARQEINLMMYMIKSDSQTVKELLQKLIVAHKRGVNVKIVLEQSSFAFNQHIDKFNKTTSLFLKENGIKNIAFDRPDQITHSKILLADKKLVVIGSTNWYASGILKHHQTGILTHNDNAVKQMKQYFDTIYNGGFK